MKDPITRDEIRAADLLNDIAKIKAHIEAAQDESTEIAYRETLHTWKAKLARVLGAKPRDGRRGADPAAWPAEYRVQEFPA